jgi:3-phosphoshikimate 1-carboxyvinyltransferase
MVTLSALVVVETYVVPGGFGSSAGTGEGHAKGLPGTSGQGVGLGVTATGGCEAGDCWADPPLEPEQAETRSRHRARAGVREVISLPRIRAWEDERVSWTAPRPHASLDAVVTLPGSKSLTNRALVLAALADGRSVVRRPLRSRDTELMADALRVLGVPVADDGDDWVVDGVPGPLTPTGTAIDVGNAGTVARFVPAVAGLARGPISFDGDPRVRERPLAPVLQALAALGVSLSSLDGLPTTVNGTGSVRGGAVTVDASQSSQFVSGLLLAAPRFDEGVAVQHEGTRLPSVPHLEMTVDALRASGATVDDTVPGLWRVAPGPLLPRDAAVEPDLSTAAAYLAAPLVAGGSVTVEGWPLGTRQPGAVLPDLLEQMGGVLTRPATSVTVSAGDRLVGIEADLADAPELTMVLTALAALASTPTRFWGVAHIRLQETDRLKALATEINSIGGDVDEADDGLTVRPTPLRGGLLSSYDDHRIAMAWAVLGLAVDGIQVDDIATTRKTVPDFVGSWTSLLGG